MFLSKNEFEFAEHKAADSVSELLPPSESCVGRCENGFDSQRKCQCDSMCKYYKSCCSDYEATCGVMSKKSSFLRDTVTSTVRTVLTQLSLSSSWRHVCVCRG